MFPLSLSVAQFLARPIIVVLILYQTIAVLVRPAQSSETSVLRKLPYPFAHMVTVANDADGQPPWYGYAIHRIMNEQLGLRIGDSFWVNTNSNSQLSAALFSGPLQRNSQASGIDGHTVFWLLVRSFHRGDYDHFHSWQDDAIHRYSYWPKQVVLLRSGRNVIELPRSPTHEDRLKISRWPQPASLRLHLDGKLPTEFSVNLKSGEHTVRVPASAIRRPARIAADADGRNVLEVLMGRTSQNGLVEFRGQPLQIELEGEFSGRFLGVEWDGFSRSLVQLQLPWLKKLNIRPVMTTAHGGYTRAQNLGIGDIYRLKPDKDPDVAATIDWIARPGGDDPKSHAYHVDLLRELGVHSAAVAPPVRYPYNATKPTRLERFHSSELWAVDKTWGLSFLPPISRADLQSRFARLDPVAANENVTDLLCTDSFLCLRSEQGPTLDFLIATSLAHVRADQGSVRHNWYQHLGTALAHRELPLSLDRPISESAERQLRRLADHMYNFGGTIPSNKRVWVPAPSVWQTYLITTRNMHDRVAVDAVTSMVRIAPVQDPVLDRTWPSLQSPTRELHGLTIYVPDSSAARVRIGEKEIVSFTRNPADESGRESVTIVNDQHPITILNGFLARHGGTLIAKNVEVSADGQKLRIVARGNSPKFSFKPESVHLSNISHVRLRVKKIGPGQLRLRMKLASGVQILLEEQESAISRDHDAIWRLPDLKHGVWTEYILGLSELAFNGGKAVSGYNPLPLGRLVEVEVGLLDSGRGASLEIATLEGLQALAQAGSPDGTVAVAGRLIDDAGKPIVGREVKLALQRGASQSTNTDQNGYYWFSDIMSGQGVVATFAEQSGSGCRRSARRALWLARNEVETDLYAAACR